MTPSQRAFVEAVKRQQYIMNLMKPPTWVRRRKTKTRMLVKGEENSPAMIYRSINSPFLLIDREPAIGMPLEDGKVEIVKEVSIVYISPKGRSVRAGFLNPQTGNWEQRSFRSRYRGGKFMDKDNNVLMFEW